MVHQEHAILNRHEAVPRPVDQQQPTGRPVQEPALHQTIILLRLLQQFLPVLVPVLGHVRLAEDERVLVVVDVLEPLAGQEQVRAGALPDAACQARVVRVRDSDRIVAARGQPPGDAFAHVELRLAVHPVQDGGEQAVGGSGVPAVGRAVGGAGDLGDDAAPAAGDEFIRSLCERHLVSLPDRQEDERGLLQCCLDDGHRDL